MQPKTDQYATNEMKRKRLRKRKRKWWVQKGNRDSGREKVRPNWPDTNSRTRFDRPRSSLSISPVDSQTVSLPLLFCLHTRGLLSNGCHVMRTVSWLVGLVPANISTSNFALWINHHRLHHWIMMTKHSRWSDECILNEIITFVFFPINLRFTKRDKCWKAIFVGLRRRFAKRLDDCRYFRPIWRTGKKTKGVWISKCVATRDRQVNAWAAHSKICCNKMIMMKGEGE